MQSLERDDDSQPSVLYAWTKVWGKNVFNWIAPLGTEPNKGFRTSATTWLSLRYASTQPAYFPPVPGKRAAAGMWFLIACWVRHTDNLGVKKGRKRWSYPVCLCSVVPCTDIRRSFCFTNMICICISEVVYVLFVYSNLLFQGINHYLLWQGVFAWKTGVWRIMWVQLQQLLFPETLNGLQNVTEEHNFIGMVTAEL